MTNMEMITTAASYTNGVKIISIRNVTASTRTELRAMIEQAAPQLQADVVAAPLGWSFDRMTISVGHRVKGRFQQVMSVPFTIGAFPA